MLNTRISNLAANAQLDALAALAAAGWVRLYSGAQPAAPESAASGTLLTEHHLSSPAFGAAAAHQITANAIGDEDNALADGQAGWFRVFAADGTTALWDGSVGTTDANCIIDDVNIVAGARVSITSFIHRLPMQGA